MSFRNHPEEKINRKNRWLTFLLIVFIISISSTSYSARTQIRGEYCYHYGDSETLIAAKDISYAMALRQAIENYKTFVTSISVVSKYQLKKDLVETIASGYVEDIKIAKQDINGRTVCTEVIAYVNPEAVKGIIAKKVARVRAHESGEFEGIIHNRWVKVLNYKRCELRKHKDGQKMIFDARGRYLFLKYQAKRYSTAGITTVIVDSFDDDANPISGTTFRLPTYKHGALYEGEVRSTTLKLPAGTVSFRLRFIN